MTRTIVGILRGGTSSEYGLSLKTGAALMNALPEEQYDVRDILIDRSGTWHVRGLPITPARALTQIDVVLNALHGGIGEDGTVQRLLERSGVPYTGARPLPASLSLNKHRAKEVLRSAGIRVPAGIGFTLSEGIDTGEMARRVFSRVAAPYIVKPFSEGASAGIRYVSTVIELPDAIADTLDQYGSALVEEYVRGEEVSIGVINGFRGEELYALPPAHVVRMGKHLERLHHESGELVHRTPSGFSFAQKQTIADIAKMAHKALALTDYSRADLIVTPRHIYLLELNANPGLYPGSSFPRMLESIGSSVKEFAEHAIQRALARR